jgi:hypothetical protein
MSASPSVSCPEPAPYSDSVSGYAEIDFVVPQPSVFSAQPTTVSVDSIVSGQVGPVTNPVTPSVTPFVAGFPVLAEVGDNNARPLLSSSSGADISEPTTLSSGQPNTMPIEEVYNSNNTTKPSTPPVQMPEPTMPMSTMPTPNEMASMTNVPRVNSPVELKNISNQNNLSNFINNNQPKIEHFNKKKVEHFFHMSAMDNIVLAIVIGAGIYYVVSLKHGSQMDVSKIPILSQLADDNVSWENKVIIVLAVVIAFVLISRMLK